MQITADIKAQVPKGFEVALKPFEFTSPNVDKITQQVFARSDFYVTGR